MKINRRTFLKTVGATASASVASPLLAQGNDSEKSPLRFSDFVRVMPDNTIQVVVKHFEAGQGPSTGLATLVAEEMNADWQQIEVLFAPADASRYANLFWGAVQGTGGSSAVANSFAQYRQAGAQALMQLKTAAAKKWSISASDIRAEKGMLVAGSRRVPYGEFADEITKLPLSAAELPLKQPKDFMHIGQENRPRKDMTGKVNGKAQYAMDVQPQNVLYAVVLRSPKFGGVLQKFDDAAAKGIDGYVGAKAIPTGVAVYGETLWAAMKARKQIKATWDFANAETRSSDVMLNDFQKSLDEAGLLFINKGDADAAIAAAKNKDAKRTISADFTAPYLAHAPMEPLNCIIQKEGDTITLWDGCQAPTFVQGAVAAVFGVQPQQIKIHTQYAGGTFGRRATPTSDYQSEAAHALKVSPDASRPLKLLWTREDDIRGGYYRPLFVHRVAAAVDTSGNISGWRHRIAGQSILTGTPFESFAVKDGLDHTSVEGLDDMPYNIAALQGDVRNMNSAVPVLWWRSVGHTHTAFAKEVTMDMLAEAAGEDALAFRLRHMTGDSPDVQRSIGVLKAAAKAADWQKSDNRFQGIAMHKSFNSYVAQVVEVSLVDDKVRVDKVTCAVDCGMAINPDMIRAQMESCVGYALGSVMRNEITLNNGEVQQSNFPDYEPIRMKDMPEVETVIVASKLAPSGVGEPGVPPLAPALSSAIYAATKKRITKMPFVAHGVSFA